ncbi:MAG: hypothetical protein ACO2Z2_06950, partial [Paracoccaceae bacterium]
GGQFCTWQQFFSSSADLLLKRDARRATMKGVVLWNLMPQSVFVLTGIPSRGPPTPMKPAVYSKAWRCQ